MAKISIRVILKSGVEFTTKCDSFTLTRNGLDQVTGYKISGDCGKQARVSGL